MSELEETHLKIRGFRAGLELENGQVRLWNKAAKSENTFAVSDIRGVELKKPGLVRGWMALRTKDHPGAPSGTMEAMSHPRTVPLAMGAWKAARRFAELLDGHIAEKTAAGELTLEDPVDPYASLGKPTRAAAKQLEAAREHLESGEKVLAYVLGAYEVEIMGKDSVRKGAFLVTDRRLLFFAKKLTGFDLEAFPYDRISSIEMGKGMMGHHISFFASGNKAKMKWINTGDVEAFVQAARSRMEGGPKAPSEESGDDPIDQIKKLAALRDAGVLSEEEFTAKKAELLTRI